MVCPKCNREFSDPPASSRRVKGIDICPVCGVKEALEDAGLDPGSSVYQAIVEEVQKIGKQGGVSDEGRYGGRL